MKKQSSARYLILGGGLQGSLIAAALLTKDKNANVVIIEQSNSIYNKAHEWSHTWCCFKSDIPPQAMNWLEPIIEKKWNQYQVSFPTYQRSIDESYFMMTSNSLAKRISLLFQNSPNAKLMLGQKAIAVSSDKITLESGVQIAGDVIIDARGYQKKNTSNLQKGFQKFLGWHVRLRKPHQLRNPIVMDNKVSQQDGFRFFYLLPTSETELLIEDTYFTRTSSLDIQKLEERILQYIKDKGFELEAITKKERGVLPLPWSLQTDTSSLDSKRKNDVIEAGYKGNWFHPITGYSLPCALKIADIISSTPPSQVQKRMRSLRKKHQKQVRFLHKLNKFFFLHFEPKHQWHLMARFYKRPKRTIHNFYALKMDWFDKAITIFGGIPRKMKFMNQQTHRFFNRTNYTQQTSLEAK